MINSVMSVPCNDCLGHGYIFFGNDKDYHTEPCDCITNPNE
jgi:hypothetical protein